MDMMLARLLYLTVLYKVRSRALIYAYVRAFSHHAVTSSTEGATLADQASCLYLPEYSTYNRKGNLETVLLLLETRGHGPTHAESVPPQTRIVDDGDWVGRLAGYCDVRQLEGWLHYSRKSHQ